MKQTLACIITVFALLAQSFAQDMEVSAKFHNKTMYYPDSGVENPVFVHITVANRGPETLRFKLADDRAFSMDFNVVTVKNAPLEKTETLVRRRTMQQTVYFREISLESGEEYSFVENLKDFVRITEPGVYYADIVFYPELYKSKLSDSLMSNRLTLEVRPSPNAASSSLVPVAPVTAEILQPEAVSPDKVVEQTIVARQRNLWDQFFLYMDLEQMLLRDPVRNRRYRSASAADRNRMLEGYKADLMQERMDRDIVSIPERFTIDKTVYTQSEGTVTTTQWFKYDTFHEKKRYTYYVRQRDGIWQIYDYTVENLGTE